MSAFTEAIEDLYVKRFNANPVEGGMNLTDAAAIVSGWLTWYSRIDSIPGLREALEKATDSEVETLCANPQVNNRLAAAGLLR